MRFTSEYKMVGLNFSYIIDFYLLRMTIQIGNIMADWVV